jgi:ataxia telangiectasia mutated family protein
MQVKSGNDDLRQDAVMQQFFWLVNQFLAQEPRTARRALFIRTFKASRGGGGGVRSRTRARNQACRYRWGWGSLHGGGVSGGACAQVVPFSPAAGLLEWVEATLPLGDYLLGPGRSGGAHMRYRRPGDLTWTEAYTKVRGAAGLLACS